MREDFDTFSERIVAAGCGRCARIVAVAARQGAAEGLSEAETLKKYEDHMGVLSVALEYWRVEKAGLQAVGAWPWRGEDDVDGS